jgi:signal transduction histidine kinase
MLLSNVGDEDTLHRLLRVARALVPGPVAEAVAKPILNLVTGRDWGNLSEPRRRETQQAIRGLQAALDIADAIGSANELAHVLELIAKRGRTLVDARVVLIVLRDGDDLVVSAGAGLRIDVADHRMPISASTLGRVFKRRRSERIADVASEPHVAPDWNGVPHAHSAVLVPMLHRGTGVGVLAAFDHGRERGAFSLADEQSLRTFASWAANAIAIHRNVEADRLRTAISAAEAERRRWARDLHDETLQALGGLRVLLASAQRRNQAIANEPAIEQAIEDIEFETDNLRAIINDLRPSLLDDFGLVPAIDGLIERRRAAGLDVISDITLDDAEALDPDLATTVYRLVQEALTNVAKHARANSARVAARSVSGQILVEVEDDGIGFDANAKTSGFGLAGMRERTYLAGGRIEAKSGAAGTLVRAWLPVPNGAGSRLSADQMAS